MAVVLAMTVAACGSAGSEGSADPSGTAPAGSSGPAEASGGASEPAGASTPAGGSGPSGASGDASEPAGPATVTLITHDSFNVDKDVLSAFEDSSGITVNILAQGDAGAMLSKLILTKENPLGDVVFGIDNTFASKALDAGIVQPYTSPLASKGSSTYAIGDDNRLTAVDFGDVCVNVDHEYFTKHDLAEPRTLEDLAKPEYRDMFVTEDAATSSPGLAFLLATIAHFGPDGWKDYWKSLKDNGVKIDAGWTDAYTVDFSGSSGKGDRPLVTSYASSPPSEVPDGATEAPTGALLDTCFRQVEYAGVLTGTEHADAAEKVIDFLLSPEFQQQIPDQMWMYPVDQSVTLPSDWATFAPVAKDPASVAPADIEANREQWISAWSDIVQG